MTHTHTTYQGQRSVGSKDRAERKHKRQGGQTDRQTDGRTDTTGCFTFSANTVAVTITSMLIKFRATISIVESSWLVQGVAESQVGRSAPSVYLFVRSVKDNWLELLTTKSSVTVSQVLAVL